jgi:hypothetical protein
MIPIKQLDFNQVVDCLVAKHPIPNKQQASRNLKEALVNLELHRLDLANHKVDFLVKNQLRMPYSTKRSQHGQFNQMKPRNSNHQEVPLVVSVHRN